jgi:hypothetical protein
MHKKELSCYNTTDSSFFRASRMLEPDKEQTALGYFHLILEEPACFGSPPLLSRNLFGLVAYSQFRFVNVIAKGGDS